MLLLKFHVRSTSRHNGVRVCVCACAAAAMFLIHNFIIQYKAHAHRKTHAYGLGIISSILFALTHIGAALSKKFFNSFPLLFSSILHTADTTHTHPTTLMRRPRTPKSNRYAASVRFYTMFGSLHPIWHSMHEFERTVLFRRKFAYIIFTTP